MHLLLYHYDIISYSDYDINHLKYIIKFITNFILGVLRLFIRTEKSVKEFMRLYPVVSTIVIINITLWFLMLFDLGKSYILVWGIGHNFSIHELNQYWRFVTPIFLHLGLTHMLFNSFALVLFGPALERMIGKFKFTIVYLLTGIIASLGTYFVAPLSNSTHLGASGAIYGLFGIYLFMVLFRKSLISGTDAQIVTTIFIIGLVMTFLDANINKSAHIFGFIGGVLFAPVILKKIKGFWR